MPVGNTKIETRHQAFDVGNKVDLYELDLTELDGTILRFTAGTDSIGNAVLFGTNLYTPIPVVATGFEYNSNAQFPRPRLRLSNVKNAVTSLLQTFDDLVGVEFKRIRTYDRFLDGGSDPDVAATTPHEIWVVRRKLSHDNLFVSWELASAVDQQGKRLPGRNIHKDACTYTYRKWNPVTGVFTENSCPYDGAAFFDLKDQAVLDPALDRCAKKFTSCIVRFGLVVEIPFQGFPGTGRVR